jgi:hypothetical protein
VEPVGLSHATRGAACCIFIYGSLNDAPSIPDYSTSTGRLISELKSILNESVSYPLEALKKVAKNDPG